MSDAANDRPWWNSIRIEVPDAVREHLPDTVFAIVDRLAVDKDRLEEEAAPLPYIYHYVLTLKATWADRLNRAKLDHDTLKAEVYRSRKYDMQAEGHKPTEKALEAEVLLDREVRRSAERLAEYTLVYEFVNSLAEALRMKSWQIGQIVELYKSGYFAVERS